MNDLTPEEVQVQGMAMVNDLHSQLSSAIARLAEKNGQIAILEVRLQNANKRIAELTPKTNG